MRLTFLCVLLLAACGSDSFPRSAGGACQTSHDCVAGLYCMPVPGEGRYCMESCTAGQRFCTGGEVCLAASTGEQLCYLGGQVALAGECTRTDDCVLGAVCAREGEQRFCRAACDATHACAAPMQCLEGGVCGVAP